MVMIFKNTKLCPNLMHNYSNSIPDEFYKHDGGMDKADTISIHAEKHLYNLMNRMQ